MRSKAATTGTFDKSDSKSAYSESVGTNSVATNGHSSQKTLINLSDSAGQPEKTGEPPNLLFSWHGINVNVNLALSCQLRFLGPEERV
jgi:hypothetical protein